MKKCPFCAEEIQDQATKCRYCGSSLEGNTETTKSGEVIARQHEQYGMLTLLCLIIPIVGIIVGIAYLTKEKKVDKKLGEHCISLGILSLILWYVISRVFVAFTI